MTDNEVIKALEYCKSENGNDCENCQFANIIYRQGEGGCVNRLMSDALDLINRQNAEIESLKRIVEQEDKEILTLQKRIINWRADIDYRPEDIKSEAIKEFAEKSIEQVEKARQKYQRLCKEQGEEVEGAMHIHFNGMVKIINNVKKEMTEVSE